MNRQKNRRISFKRKTAFLFLFLNGGVVFLGLCLGYYWGARLLRDTIETKELECLSSTVSMINTNFDSHLKYLLAFSGSPLWGKSIINSNEARFKASQSVNDPLNLRLMHLSKSLIGIESILVTDKSGALVASSGEQQESNFSDKKWWRDAFAAKDPPVIIEKLASRPLSGAVFMSISMPVILDTDEVIGVCRFVIDSRNLLFPMAKADKIKSGYMTLLDDSGAIFGANYPVSLAGGLINQVLVSKMLESKTKASIVRAPSLKKQAMFAAFQKIGHPLFLKNGLDLILVTESPLKSFLLPLRALVFQFIALLVFLSSVILLVAVHFGKGISRSVSELKKGLERFKLGDYGYRIRLKSNDEIEEVADSFNGLAEIVIAERADIQRRTKELEITNDSLSRIARDFKEANDELITLRRSLQDNIQEKTKELRDSEEALLNILEDFSESKELIERSNAELNKAYEEIKRTQASLIQSEKMAALGRFSSGIAHEVKNPLGIILGGVEFLSVKLADAPPEVNIALTKIKEAVFRADSVLKNLLRYGRPSKLLAEQIRPEALINEVIELFRYKTPLYNIEISTEYDRQDMFVAVDKSQMQQVFFNLLLNSIDAMPSGGRITIKTFRASYDGELKSGGAACAIIVSDTGMGVAKEDLDKIFEPFFTTKRDRGGTGLGLGVSKSIVENHGGCLIVTSELGKGTDIKIVLPLAKQGG